MGRSCAWPARAGDESRVTASGGGDSSPRRCLPGTGVVGPLTLPGLGHEPTLRKCDPLQSSARRRVPVGRRIELRYVVGVGLAEPEAAVTALGREVVPGGKKHRAPGAIRHHSHPLAHRRILMVQFLDRQRHVQRCLLASPLHLPYFSANSPYIAVSNGTAPCPTAQADLSPFSGSGSHQPGMSRAQKAGSRTRLRAPETVRIGR